MTYAQNKSFEGASIGLTVNSNSDKLNSDQFPSSVSGSSTTMGVRADYGWGIGNAFVLGVSASYDTGERDIGSTIVGGNTLKFKAKDITTLGFNPGYRVSPDLLVYGTGGYVSGSTKAISTPTKNYDFDGTFYGAGVKYLFAKNWSAGLELTTADIKATNKVDTGNAKTSSTTVSAGVNYHF